ncbi:MULTISPECIES: glycogen debranching protein GlgX [unclassified Arthrobacter]|uniref:glycogen debranching protein GlgX n=1 Tax=unclassified Arthrobacter TaxID=235627 RepID=UPI0021046277|nr:MULTISPECIES: glycogen debranching protein GlgX [unclassified Arthrobacter]MCQ1948306.1 glycogen debranching protein GlgX [Arthrobacter sp. zg-Y1116]MCQ1996683.1 glycogen debranching protein GlgX [Arthrobacter sp. zg-Y1171]UWX82280.1 glycogen debranching protein GlgX [Arthrobacter sp. zg-Y1171]
MEHVIGGTTAGSASKRDSRPLPLGVRHTVSGVPDIPDAVNVSVYAPGLPAVDVYYETAPGHWSTAPLTDTVLGIHHGRVYGLRPGSRYGFWPRGRSLPAEPGSFQLLLDPYGRGIEADPVQGSQVYYSVYTAGDFDWGTVRRPHTPWRDTVIYEAHVRGQTMLHPGIPEELRGTYAGMGHPVMVQYLQDLGITAVELLPVHFHADELHLQELGLANYWGYNTLGFFAPHDAYATRAAREAGAQAVQDELKGMVKSLHEAGIEVLLDVVYNHTAEGEPDQPALSWRGLGDETYYRHGPDGGYVDTTGCGNTLDFSEPRIIQLALDSLRYWVQEYHVDGFRFDLAPSLCRGADGRFDPRHPFLVAVAADSVLQDVKLISEPWDVGPDGWQTGRFPQGWADWNDHFRDIVRDFWLRGQADVAAGREGGSLARLAGALAGSAELFVHSGRTPLASINFVTAHDGFTLSDLTMFERKHNEANGEENRDGTGENRSYNHGMEGPTDDERINAARSLTARNLMATLTMSLGVPMLTAGDEIGRSQRGNNNAYCQDNELSWLNWNLDDAAQRMLSTTRELLRLRREYLASQPYRFPADRRQSFLLWFDQEGKPMTPEQWSDPATRVVQVLIGSGDGSLNGLMVLNGTLSDVEVRLPDAPTVRSAAAETGNGFEDISAPGESSGYELVFSTASDPGERRGQIRPSGTTDLVPANSISLYRA